MIPNKLGLVGCCCPVEGGGGGQGALITGCLIPASDLLITWYGYSGTSDDGLPIQGPYEDTLVFSEVDGIPGWNSAFKIVPQPLSPYQAHYDDGTGYQFCLYYRFVMACSPPCILNVEYGGAIVVEDGLFTIDLPACALPSPSQVASARIIGGFTDAVPACPAVDFLSYDPFAMYAWIDLSPDATGPPTNFFATGLVVPA